MNTPNDDLATVRANLDRLVFQVDRPAAPTPARSPGDGRWAPPLWSLALFGVALVVSGFGSGIWVSRAVATNALARASEADQARAAAATTFRECSQKVMETLNHGNP